MNTMFADSAGDFGLGAVHLSRVCLGGVVVQFETSPFQIPARDLGKQVVKLPKSLGNPSHHCGGGPDLACLAAPILIAWPPAVVVIGHVHCRRGCKVLEFLAEPNCEPIKPLHKSSDGEDGFTNFCARAHFHKSLRAKRLASSSPIGTRGFRRWSVVC